MCLNEMYFTPSLHVCYLLFLLCCCCCTGLWHALNGRTQDQSDTTDKPRKHAITTTTAAQSEAKRQREAAWRAREEQLRREQQEREELERQRQEKRRIAEEERRVIREAAQAKRVRFSI